LVSWWPGDGNANDIAGPNNGQLFGGATYVPGFVGQGFKFDGIDGYFESAALDLPVWGADRTLEMWVKLDSILPPDVTTSDYFEAFFAGYGEFGSSTAFFSLFSEHQPPYGNALAWTQWFDQLAGPLLSEGEPFQRNRGWHHVAVTLSGGTNIGVVLFLDGAPVARRQNFVINTPPGTSFLMGRIPGPLGDIRRMHGQLDEVTVYNRALLPQEIAAIYAAGTAGKCKP
jgi:Concanavalin A-like lectin/glucanases superfamily